MRVLILTAEFPPTAGGVGDYAAQLQRALSSRATDAGVVTGRGAGSSGDKAVTPLGDRSVIRLPTRWRWAMWRKIERTIAAVRPDVVHLQYQTGAYGQHPAINMLPLYLRARRVSPVVVTMHDLLLPYLFPRADRLRRWVTRRLVHDTAAVIVTNDEDRGRLTGRIAGDRTQYADQHLQPYLIPIGSNIPVNPPSMYDRQRWRGDLGIEHRRVVGYFGLMSPSKGVLPLVESLAHMQNDVILLLIGGAMTTAQEREYGERVTSTIDRLGLQQRVVMTGTCSPGDVSGHLLACDVIALPFLDGASWRRGSLLAALEHGIPVVTTVPSSPVEPPLPHGTVAFQIPSAEPAGLARAIMTVLTDWHLQQTLAAGGRRAVQPFQWEAIAGAHEVVYNAVIHGQGSGRHAAMW